MVYLEFFSTYLKLGWVKRLLENTSGTWQAVSEQQFRHLGFFFDFLGVKKKHKDAISEVPNSFQLDFIFG